MHDLHDVLVLQVKSHHVSCTSAVLPHVLLLLLCVRFVGLVDGFVDDFDCHGCGSGAVFLAFINSAIYRGSTDRSGRLSGYWLFTGHCQQAIVQLR